MTPAAPAQTFQVTLLGTRLKEISDAELIAELRAKLKLSPEQAASLLSGRRTVKRGVDIAAAQRLIGLFTQIGLKAIVENMPAPAPRAAAPAKTIVKEETRAPAPEPRNPLAALQALASQNLPKPRISPGYLLSLLVVTLLCVAMPAIYLCFTAGIAAGWVWYLTHIHLHLPRSIHLIVLAYAVPGLAGAVLLLFLLRPILARRPREGDALIIDATKEPGLVDGVRALCRAIGVSAPHEIHISWDANASVHFRNGWRGLLTGRKVLTIGMSLVAGLNA